jgi:2-methylcitrate dehydratase PrpD
VTDDRITSAFTDFVAGLDDTALAGAPDDALRWFVLDGVANVVAGSRTRIAQDQAELFRTWCDAGPVRLMGSTETTNLPFGVYLAASSANQLDFDDTYATFAHPGATTIGPAFALASERPVTGRALLTAIAIGYEVQVRIMSAGLPTPERRKQISGFAVWQGLGTAAVAARLRGLDADRVRHALGLAAFNAPVPNFPKLGLGDERPGASVKNNYGWAAMGGLLGVLMAERGARGNAKVLDGPSGFWAMAGSDRFDEEAAIDGLGTRFLFPDTSPKPYAACRWAHPAIDAARALRPEVGDDAIDAIEVRGFGEMVRCLAWARPVDMVDAQFSVPHLVALELLGRSARDGLRDDDLDDPAVRDLADRVVLRHAPEMDAGFHAGRLPAAMTVRLASGRRVEVARDDASPTPDQPYTHDDAWRKFLALTEPVLGRDRAERLGEAVLTLDAAPDAAAVVDLARPAEAAAA